MRKCKWGVPQNSFWKPDSQTKLCCKSFIGINSYMNYYADIDTGMSALRRGEAPAVLLWWEELAASSQTGRGWAFSAPCHPWCHPLIGRYPKRVAESSLKMHLLRYGQALVLWMDGMVNVFKAHLVLYKMVVIRGGMTQGFDICFRCLSYAESLQDPFW